MEVEWPPAREAGAQRVWRELLQPIATDMRMSAPKIAEEMVSHIREKLPDMFPDAHTAHEACGSTEESLRQLAQIIEAGADPTRVELPPSTQAILRLAVWRRVPLSDHMRFYRLAQDQLWKWLFARITAVARDVADQATALDLTSGWLFAFVDRAMIRANEAYEFERETWLRGAAATTAAAIEDILGDRERDERAASKRLRYELARYHVGLIAWFDHRPDDGDALSQLSAAIADISKSVLVESTITHPLGSLALAAWFSSHRPLSLDDGQDVSRTRLTSLPAGVSIAFGERGHGIRGFRRTHLEAGHARRVASLTSQRTGDVTRYRNVAVTAMCTADGEHASAFVASVLGPLAAADEQTCRLATTMAMYLRENLSRSRAAVRLGVHPNTVSYRVHQAEELLGRSADSDSLDIQVALTLLPAVRNLGREQAG
jgi:hypothetical protein